MRVLVGGVYWNADVKALLKAAAAHATGELDTPGTSAGKTVSKIKTS